MEDGIPFNVGEGEETIKEIIKDAINNALKPLYWQKDYVDLRKAPLPDLPNIMGDGYKRAINNQAGIDTSEGCPNDCSFCCVTQLRGRKMTREHSRDPEAIIEWLEQVYKVGLRKVMFLDDNFRRSYIYDELVEKINQAK